MEDLLMVKVCKDDEMLWCYGFHSDMPQMHGVTSMTYYEDGTINKIRAALQLALDQLDFSLTPIIKQEDELFVEEDAMEKYLSEIKGEVARFVFEEEACQK